MFVEFCIDIEFATIYTTKYNTINKIKIMLQRLPKTIGISEVRQNATTFFKEVNQSDDPRFVLVNNKLQAVVLNPSLYQSLLEAWEDRKDAEILDKRIKESNGKFYTFDEIDKMRV